MSTHSITLVFRGHDQRNKLFTALIINSNMSFQEIYDQLAKLAGRDVTVREVAIARHLTEDEAKARWRQEVAAEATELAFADWWQENQVNDRDLDEDAPADQDPEVDQLLREIDEETADPADPEDRDTPGRRFVEGLVAHLNGLYPDLRPAMVEVQEVGDEFRYSFPLPSGTGYFSEYTRLMGEPDEDTLAKTEDAVREDLRAPEPEA